VLCIDVGISSHSVIFLRCILSLWRHSWSVFFNDFSEDIYESVQLINYISSTLC
jgi:hypothetical protein